MRDHLRKRSVSLAGHRTSLALEPAFWDVLERAASAEGVSLAGLIGRLDAARGPDSAPLSSTARVWALAWAGRGAR